MIYPMLPTIPPFLPAKSAEVWITPCIGGHHAVWDGENLLTAHGKDISFLKPQFRRFRWGLPNCAKPLHIELLALDPRGQRLSMKRILQTKNKGTLRASDLIFVLSVIDVMDKEASLIDRIKFLENNKITRYSTGTDYSAKIDWRKLPEIFLRMDRDNKSYKLVIGGREESMISGLMVRTKELPYMAGETAPTYSPNFILVERDIKVRG